jgi:hypothetical protein
MQQSDIVRGELISLLARDIICAAKFGFELQTGAWRMTLPICIKA